MYGYVFLLSMESVFVSVNCVCVCVCDSVCLSVLTRECNSLRVVLKVHAARCVCACR